MKITRRQLRKIIKESIDDTSIEDLLKILRPLKSNEQSNHKMFVSVVPYILAEYTPLGEHLGVVKLTEEESDKYYTHYGYGSDIKIEFKDDASLDNFVAMLNSVGLERGLHFGSVKYKSDRLRALRNPYVRFSAVDYSEDIDDIEGPPLLDEARNQLRKLIIETFFVNPEGEVIDLSGEQPLYADERVKKLVNHPDENIRSMARQTPEDYKQALELAAYGYDDDSLALSPEEEQIQDLHDEFGVDSDYGYEHVSRDDEPETDWYGFIEQLKPIVDRAIEDAIALGITDDAVLHKIMVNLPSYKALYNRIDREAGWEADVILPQMNLLADEVMIRNDINPLGRFT